MPLIKPGPINDYDYSLQKNPEIKTVYSHEDELEEFKDCTKKPKFSITEVIEGHETYIVIRHKIG